MNPANESNLGETQWQGVHVLVTGGTGFMGSFLVEELLSRGAVVTVLYRGNTGWLTPIADKVKWLYGDLLDMESLIIDPSIEIIFHAASFRKNAQYHRDYVEKVSAANVLMSTCLLQSIPASLQLVVFFSTGNIPPSLTVESSLENISDGYVKGKLCCEKLWLKEASKGGWSLVRVRPTNAYGPRSVVGPEASVLPALFWRIIHDENPLHVYAPATLARPFVFANDVIRATMKLASLSKEKRMDIASYVYPPWTNTLAEAIAILQTQLAKNIPVRYSETTVQPIELEYEKPHPVLADMNWTELKIGLKQTVEWWNSTLKSIVMNRTLIVIPCYNERANIAELLTRLRSLYPAVDILVVDDQSPDGSAAVIQKCVDCSEGHIELLERSGKGGRGSAVLAGFAKGLAKDYEFFIEMDADFSHKPEEIALFFEKIRTCDVVIGSRYVSGSSIQNWGWGRTIFSAFANHFARLVLRIPIADYTNGFRCYTRAALQSLDFSTITAKGYIVLSEVSYQLFRKGFRFGEVPTIFVNRRRGNSNFNLQEVLEAFFSIVRIRWPKFLSQIWHNS